MSAENNPSPLTPEEKIQDIVSHLAGNRLLLHSLDYGFSKSTIAGLDKDFEIAISFWQDPERTSLSIEMIEERWNAVQREINDKYNE